MVGIITFHRAVNYGAVLQCYALQKTLDDMGISNEVIDYRCNHIERVYSPKPSVSPKHLRRFVKDIFEAPQKIKARKNFNSFLKNNIKTTRGLTKKELVSFATKYNTVICGSDQVWNPISTNGDYSYLLNFVSDEKNKISYSASIGTDDLNGFSTEKVKECLASFNSVSIREPSSYELISKLYKGSISINVDPTILIEKDWEKIAETSKLKIKDFIFVYVMQPSEELYQLAEKLAKDKGLRVISISMTERKCKIGENVKGIEVNDFLWLIKNASYIVTNSFHGLIFSMIFEKEFYWDYQEGKSMSNKRFDMLKEQYSIGQRCFDNNKNIYDYKELDYVVIKSTMKKQKEESLNYLKSNI